jgi:hypothetical protein
MRCGKISDELIMVKISLEERCRDGNRQRFGKAALVATMTCRRSGFGQVVRKAGVAAVWMSCGMALADAANTGIWAVVLSCLNCSRYLQP